MKRREAFHPHHYWLSPESFPSKLNTTNVPPLGPFIIQSSCWVMQTAAKERWRCTQVSGIFWLRSWALPMPRLLTLLVADLPNSLWVWPASPRAGNPPKAHDTMGLESLPFSLCFYYPTPSFRNRDLIEGLLSGRMDPYGLAGQQRVSEKMSGKWEAGSSMVAVLKRKKRKRRSTSRRWFSACTFTSGDWLLVWEWLDALQCTPWITECRGMAFTWPRTGSDLVLLLREVHHLLCNQNFPEAPHSPNLPSKQRLLVEETE